MKKLFATLCAIGATSLTAFADAYDYGKISMIDGYGDGDNTTRIILALIGISYLFSQWMEKK